MEIYQLGNISINYIEILFDKFRAIKFDSIATCLLYRVVQGIFFEEQKYLGKFA